MGNITPLGNNILAKRLKLEPQSRGSIILPDSQEFIKDKAEIISIGSESNDEFKVGDKIMFYQYSGTEVTFENQDYVLFKPEDILAIIED